MYPPPPLQSHLNISATTIPDLLIYHVHLFVVETGIFHYPLQIRFFVKKQPHHAHHRFSSTLQISKCFWYRYLGNGQIRAPKEASQELILTYLISWKEQCHLFNNFDGDWSRLWLIKVKKSQNRHYFTILSFCLA